MAELMVGQLVAGYGRREVLRGIDLQVHPGGVTALFGHNGAGKSTLLRCLAGLVHARAGQARLDDQDILGWPAWRRRQHGLVLVPQQSAVFPGLTVGENLELGARGLEHGELERRMARVFATFPALADRLRQLADSLSGGQQRMLAVGIALMGEPRVLLLDEPTIGLAPNLAQQLLDSVSRLTAELGLTTLVVEQNVQLTRELCEYVYVMKVGKIIAAEPRDVFRARPELWSLF